MTTPRVQEPETIRQGDTVTWAKQLADYVPGDGWTLTYAFATASDRQVVSAASGSDGDYLVTITATESAAWIAGETYYGQAYVEKAGERHTVWEGRVTVQAGLHLATHATGYDSRSHAVKVLEALRATIEGKASKDMLSLSIAGRSISVMGPDEITTWETYYVKKVARELAAERRAQGKPSRSRVGIGFREPS